MASTTSGLIHKKLATCLIAAAVLASEVQAFVAPAMATQAHASQAGSNQQNVEAMIERAERLEYSGDLSAATAIWQQILTLSEKILGPGHHHVVISLDKLSGLLWDQEKYAAAEFYERRSLEISEKAHGPDHPDVAKRLKALAGILRVQGQYAAAEPLLRRAQAIYERAQGHDHPDVAITLNNLAGVLRGQGRYAEAETVLRRSQEIYERINGPDHPDVANSLNNLAVLLAAQGRHSEAAPLYQRSLAIREKVLDPDHPAIANSLNNLAGLLRDQGQYFAAEPLSRRSLAIFEKTLGSDHPTVATSLNNLAGLLNLQGRYAEAEPLYHRSLAISEKVLGPDHPDIANSLNNLAGLLMHRGRYDAAETIYDRSLAIYEKALGPDHPEVANSLDNSAQLLVVQGRYTEAGSLYQRSLAIREKALGPDHPDIAHSLNHQGRLLEDQGQYALAEPLLRRAQAIAEKALGPDHPIVASSLSDLAGLLYQQERYAEAEPLYRQSLAISEKALGLDHPNVASIISNLAALLEDQGKYAEAWPLHYRSIAILEKTLGPDHPAIANSLNNMAWGLVEQGKHSAAEALYRRSLAIREKSLGPDHPDVAASLYNLALALHGQRHFGSIAPILHRSGDIEASWLLQELPLLAPHARSAQLQELGDAWELSFGWIHDHSPLAHIALETRLNRQGLPEIEQHQTKLLNAPTIDRTKIEQLQALTQQLSSVTLRTDIRAEVRKQWEKLQIEVYRQIPELKLQLVAIAAVAKALPVDGVLVEFQRYQPFDGRKPKDQRWGDAQYIALVLKSNASVAAVPLGPAAGIDATIHRGLRATADGLSDADGVWAQLSEQILKPLLPHLPGSREWFLSPDGELNRVPFGALPAPQQAGTLLTQMVQLRLLTTGRELLRLQQPTSTSSAALVMANPSYDRLSATPTSDARSSARTTAAQQRSADMGSNLWKPLPASEREGQKVAKLLGTELISGSSATTKALQRHQAPRVLHVATHGFFIADQESKPSEPMRTIQEGSPLLRSLRQEDPQLRSGLVLAGANQPDLDPNDDGYLTAAEAVNLNLKGTELVVLSACSTGQGDVRTGEGVYGLQRSLTVAGARSTLLSLWKVDDDATAEFMGRYYQRLKAGEGRSDALAAVQGEFRSGKAQSSGSANWKEPYYWAAWQLVGDWRPIPDL